jgi:hypothetical protein
MILATGHHLGEPQKGIPIQPPLVDRYMLEHSAALVAGALVQSAYQLLNATA